MTETRGTDESPTRTAIAGANAARITRIGKLVLRWRDHQMVLNMDSKPIVMGRSNHIDISVDSDFASRKHAHLRVANSCFVLADCSRNGTYVNMNDNEVYIHDDELILRGSGCISMGRRAASARGKLVYFSTEAAVALLNKAKADT